MSRFVTLCSTQHKYKPNSMKTRRGKGRHIRPLKNFAPEDFFWGRQIGVHDGYIDRFTDLKFFIHYAIRAAFCRTQIDRSVKMSLHWLITGVAGS